MPSYCWGKYTSGTWLILNCSVNAGKEISGVSYDCEHYSLIFSWGSEHCWSLPVWVLLASYSLTLKPQELPFSPEKGRKFHCGGWVATHCPLWKQMVEERMFFLSLLCDTATETPLGWEPQSPVWLLLPSLEPGQCWNRVPDTGKPAEHCQARGSWLAEHRPQPGPDLPADWAHRIQ